MYILVLSNGGFDGLGRVREKEMGQAAKAQGFADWKVLDHLELKDGPCYEWKPQVIAEEIEKHLKERKSEGISIESIVTFDELGISHHPNHISVHHGCMNFYRNRASALGIRDMYTL